MHDGLVHVQLQGGSSKSDHEDTAAPSEFAWIRGRPPKFRRLILSGGAGSTQLEKIQEDRRNTRYVFVTNVIGDVGDGSAVSVVGDLDPSLVKDALQRAVKPYIDRAEHHRDQQDQSDRHNYRSLPVEIFIPNKKNKSPF